MVRSCSWTLSSFFVCIGVVGCSLINAPDKIRPGGGGATASSSSTGAPPECTMDVDCAAKASDCHKASCAPDGTCVVTQLAAGAACGDAKTSQCDAADTCDAMGTCQANLAPNGTFCSDCPMGPGKCALCSGGKCNDCTTRAKLKTFQNAHSAAGWQVSNPLDWGVYEQSPPSLNPMKPGFVFAHPVFGTDGNRAHPWPGHEVENSHAESPPTVIPAQLQFLSWNLDEGSNYDEKTISVSIDGGMSYIVVAECSANIYPFCQNTFSGASWKPVSIDLAGSTKPDVKALVGHVGTVKFQYNTHDEATGFEQGWYIDQLNFAQDCACGSDADCTLENGICATGKCDAATSECRPAPQAMDMPCGDMMAHECNDLPTCDAMGLCNPNWLPKEAVACTTCPDGVCVGCGAGKCLSCPAVQAFGDQLGALNATMKGWTLTGDWKITNSTPPDNFPVYGSTLPNNINFTTDGMGVGGMPTKFPNYTLGTDGVRTSPYYTLQGVSPNYYYQATPNHVESSSARTPTVLIPQQLTFKSWHQDRGGNQSPPHDVKRIRVTMDMGMTYKTLVDCNGGVMSTLPFCAPVASRMADSWDMISIDTGSLAGQKGQVEFDYDSFDTGSNTERGWYIDDLNVARCGDH